MLQKIAEYRPHALLEFLINGKNAEATTWFNKQILPGGVIHGAFGGRVAMPHQLYAEVQRRFIPINDLLVYDNKGPVNYINITTEQRAVINKVCATDKGGTVDSDAYVKFMKDLHKLLTQNKNHLIKELTEPQYDDIYRRTRWVDDAHMELLYERTSSGGIRDHIVEESALFGRGKPDPLVRAWFDNATGLKVFDSVRQALNPNEKQLLENMKKISEAIKFVYGIEPWSPRAAAYLIAGWAETMKADFWADFVFLTDAFRFSPSKRLWGLAADAKGLNEIEHIFEEASLALGADIKHLAPHTKAAIEKWLGISIGEVGGIELRVPLHLYRGRLLVLIAALFFLAHSGKSVEEEIGGASGSKH